MSDKAQNPPEKASQTKAFVGEACISTLGSLIFAILFGIYTSDPKYYGGGGDVCIDLLKWGKIMYFLMSAGVIFSGLISPLLYCSMNCWPNADYIKFSTFSLYAVRVGYGLASLVLFIALCVAYSAGEPCGDLKTLTMVYIILVACSLGLAVLILCCVCCCALCVGGSVLGMAAMQENGNKGGYNAIETGNNKA